MNNLISRAYQKTLRCIFYYTQRSLFSLLGQGCYVVSPYRVDGAENIEIGANTLIQRGSWLYCQTNSEQKPKLTLGAGCILGYNNHIAAVRQVIIGNDVLTANNVYISDNIHAYEDITKPVMHQPVLFKREVVIGAGAWIGENVSIIGASVGKNSVIGANSVVTRDIPDYCVAVGAPAVVIRQFDLQSQKWIDRKDFKNDLIA